MNKIPITKDGSGKIESIVGFVMLRDEILDLLKSGAFELAPTVLKRNNGKEQIVEFSIVPKYQEKVFMG